MFVPDTKKEPKDLGPRMSKNHHAVTIVLGMETEADDPGIHHHDATVAQGTEEQVNDPDPCDIHMITKTTKSRWGAPCFTLRIHRTPVPKGFKLPRDHQKYDGSQEPQSWLYHVIPGRPTFPRFMAVPHYTYLVLKMPGPNGIIIVKGSFELSDISDKEFHKMAQTFGTTAET
jgi:hypothetical protein